MARLFFSAPDGQDGTQVIVQSVGQGPTRQLASLIEAGDLPGAVLPPGDFPGQMLYWDGVEWLPVPSGAGAVVITEGFETPVGQSAVLQSNSLARVTWSEIGVAFFGATPVPPQSFSGTTLQEQIDSLVAALVIFGLGTDDRTPAAALTQIGWAPVAAGEQSTLFQLVAAGHDPGFYQVSIEQFVRTTVVASYGQEVVTWSDNGGAQSISSLGNTSGSPVWSSLGLAINSVTGARIQLTRTVHSDGVSAITARVTSGGVMGNPALLNIHAYAFKLAD